MKLLPLRALGYCAALTTLTATGAIAQTAANADRIMNYKELRACMELKQQADRAAAQVRARQNAFEADRDALKVDQTRFAKSKDELVVRSETLNKEQQDIIAARSAVNAKLPTVKSDEEKTALAQQLTQLADRATRFDKDATQFDADLKAHNERATELNTRVIGINERAKTVNDGVDEAADLNSDWRNRCGNRRYREEDEAEIKKELGLTK